MKSKNRPAKCQKCGWVYPAAYKANICKFCGGGVYRDVGTEPGYCKKCGAYCENINRYNNKLCSQCNSKAMMLYAKSRPDYREKCAEMSNKMWHKYKAEAIKQYEDWLVQLRQLSTHTLTEDEWIQACKYFDGCALCGEKSIDARTYFIQYSEGGRYNACNIVPACDRCATAFKKNKNPFITMNEVLSVSNSIYRGQSKKNLQKVVDYLRSKIEEAKNEPTGKNQGL